MNDYFGRGRLDGKNGEREGPIFGRRGSRVLEIAIMIFNSWLFFTSLFTLTGNQ